MTYYERALLIFIASVIEDRFYLTDEEHEVIIKLIESVAEEQPEFTTKYSMKELKKLSTFYDRGKMAP